MTKKSRTRVVQGKRRGEDAVRKKVRLRRRKVKRRLKKKIPMQQRWAGELNPKRAVHWRRKRRRRKVSK
jgi:hypothetical protein